MLIVIPVDELINRLPNIAIQLNRFLGDCVGERALLGELLDSDGPGEMVEVLDTWQIPSSPHLDLTLGTEYSPPVLGQQQQQQQHQLSGYADGLAALADLPERGDLVYWSDSSRAGVSGSQLSYAMENISFSH